MILDGNKVILLPAHKYVKMFIFCGHVEG